MIPRLTNSLGNRKTISSLKNYHYYFKHHPQRHRRKWNGILTLNGDTIKLQRHDLLPNISTYLGIAESFLGTARFLLGWSEHGLNDKKIQLLIPTIEISQTHIFPSSATIPIILYKFCKILFQTIENGLSPLRLTRVNFIQNIFATITVSVIYFSSCLAASSETYSSEQYS